PFIIACDNGADPDYTFFDIANLVRMVRIDFGAEVRFLDERDDRLGPVGRECVGSLDALRRPVVKDGSDGPAEAYSRRHATVAEVFYDGETSPGTTIVFLKPTLVGDESQDLIQYYRSNSSFPQQTTMDQYFDEAQWESYRKLGEEVA